MILTAPIMNRPRANSLNRQRGVGLIEVLVAVLILSIGLLGIAWVQTRALSNNNSSMARSMAVVASYSILDAMRADRTNALAEDYNVEIDTEDCGDDDATLAEAQITSWCNELAATLGASAKTKGSIECDNTGECVVTITFDDSRVGKGESVSDAETVITRAML